MKRTNYDRRNPSQEEGYYPTSNQRGYQQPNGRYEQSDSRYRGPQQRNTPYQGNYDYDRRQQDSNDYSDRRWQDQRDRTGYGYDENRDSNQWRSDHERSQPRYSDYDVYAEDRQGTRGNMYDEYASQGVRFNEDNRQYPTGRDYRDNDYREDFYESRRDGIRGRRNQVQDDQHEWQYNNGFQNEYQERNENRDNRYGRGERHENSYRSAPSQNRHWEQGTDWGYGQHRKGGYYKTTHQGRQWMDRSTTPQRNEDWREREESASSQSAY